VKILIYFMRFVLSESEKFFCLTAKKDLS